MPTKYNVNQLVELTKNVKTGRYDHIFDLKRGSIGTILKLSDGFYTIEFTDPENSEKVIQMILNDYYLKEVY